MTDIREKDEWRPIRGMEGMYEISDHGQVRSNRLGAPRLLTPQRNRRGYLRVNLTVKGKRHDRYVHRLVLDAFFGPQPDGMQARHIDGDKTNNTPSNLVWGTVAENFADKEAHGTVPRGERQGNAVLTADQVREIRAAAAAGVPQIRLVRAYGVADSTISGIVKRKAWRHVG